MKEDFSIKGEAVLNSIFNNMHSGMVVCEAIYNNQAQMVDCRYIMMNQAYADLTELVVKEATGKRVLEALPGTEPEWFSTFGHVVKTGEALQFEMYHDVTNKHYSVRATRSQSDTFIATFDDITERMLTKQQLVESKIRFRALSDATFEAIFISEKGICIEANKAAAEMFGYKPNKLIGIFGTDVIADESKEFVKANILKGYEDPYEAVAIKKDGTKFHAVFRGKMFIYKGNETRITAVRDITRRKKAEQELQQSEEKLKSTIASIDDLVFVIDKNGLFSEYYNPNHKEVLFLDPEYFYNKHYLEIGFPEEINNNFTKAFNILKKSDEVQEFDYSLEIKGETNWYNAKLSQQKDNKGDFSGITVVARNITLRKNTELALIEKNKALSLVEKKLRTANEKLTVTTQELKQNNNKLKLAIERAEGADRLKSAFLMNMSHEIRTPMNGIIGFTRLLRNDDLSESKRDNFINIIGQSSKKLLNIINDIIDISKIETGQFDVNVKETCVNDVLIDLFSFHKIAADKNNIELFLEKSLNDELSKIQTDPLKLRQILDNLLNNALKFTHKGFVKFGYDLKNNELLFYVEDTGIGIKKEMYKRIFDQFRQAEVSHSNVYGGTGLGLSIAKAYVKKLGGEIYLNSETKKGTTFYFSIPYKLISQSNVLVEKIVKSSEKKLVLVVEDEDINFLLIEEILSNKNVQLLHAKTGAEAIKYCENKAEIRLVLMDIKLPDMNGYEVTKEIRTFRKDLPIIAQTAYALYGDREKSIDAGCNDYIAKPIERDDFLEIVEKYL
ncbi:MAG: hypothetical protein DRI95_14350 [Bacteroidetes bacterium]|nr:MAG: hypothetical protein DRI95_14350 [Bacteroidota bacterium]